MLIKLTLANRLLTNNIISKKSEISSSGNLISSDWMDSESEAKKNGVCAHHTLCDFLWNLSTPTLS